MNDYTIHRITDVAGVQVAAVLFDHQPQPEASERFVASADQPAGMITRSS